MFYRVKILQIKQVLKILFSISFVVLLLFCTILRSKSSNNDFEIAVFENPYIVEATNEVLNNSKIKISEEGKETSSDYVQSGQARHVGPRPDEPVRRILWWSTIYGGDQSFFGIGSGEALISLQGKCKVKCEFTVDPSLLGSSHGVIFHGWGSDLLTETIVIGNKSVTIPKNAPQQRYQNQMYIYMSLEAPSRIRTNMEAYKEFFNWTMTYRLDSDFPIPYGRFVKKSPAEIQAQRIDYEMEGIDDIELLTKRPNLVAWMVSNCDDVPSERNRLVQELQKYIPITIYGKCGTNSCNNIVHSDCWMELGMSHKFYLSFENSLCKDYVTEKFFNTFRARMVPVVYGKANYGHEFAPGSFINVDSFPSAKALAQYLMYLNRNDKEYLRYLEWRRYYRLHQGWPLEEAYCAACERLHIENPPATSIVDINDWLFRKNSENPICNEPPAKF